MFVKQKRTEKKVQQQLDSIKIKRAINSSLNSEQYCSLLQLEIRYVFTLEAFNSCKPLKARAPMTSKEPPGQFKLTLDYF